MSDAQETKAVGRPWHLWLVGIVGFLWSSIGVMGFLMVQLKVEAVLSQYPPDQREYFETFPFWAVAFWAIGVFGGTIGCLLMLLKQRVAVPILIASTIGAIVSNYGGLFFLGGMEVMGGATALLFPTFIVLFAAFLALYSRAMRERGVLS